MSTNTQSNFTDFSFAKASYAKFRPTYPPEVYETILERVPGSFRIKKFYLKFMINF